jgi:excisionase family DNA binding protein
VIEEWLAEVPPPPPAGWARAVTPGEAGRLTDTSAARVMDAVEDGELPALRYNNEVRIRRSDVRAWGAAIPRTVRVRPRPPAVPIPDGAELVTVPEAAAELGVSTRHVHHLVRRGKLPGARRGWRVMIPRAAVEARRLAHRGTRPGDSQTGPRQ